MAQWGEALQTHPPPAALQSALHRAAIAERSNKQPRSPERAASAPGSRERGYGESGFQLKVTLRVRDKKKGGKNLRISAHKC